jgi:parallel beta-helix repeat protein
MTAYYIDPSAATNGTGTSASPYNTWTGVPVGAGYQYFQKRGTSWTGTFPVLTAGTSGNLTLVSSYYNADGSDDTTQAKPILNLGDSQLQIDSFMKMTNMDVRNSRVTMAGTMPAIFFKGGATDSEVSSCTVTSNLAGIGAYGSSRITIANNIITAATATSLSSNLAQGIFLNNSVSCDSVTITGNTIYLGTTGTQVRGIYCITNGPGFGLTNLLVKSNTITLIAGSAALASDSTSHFGVSVTYAISPEISYNTITSLSLGMVISTGCSNPWVHHNTCNYNGSKFYGGILVTSTTIGSLVEWNTCRHNVSYGILVDNTNDANITRFNDCSLTQLDGSGIANYVFKCVVYGNTLYKNGGAGIVVGSTGWDDTGGRIITGNYLIQNTTDQYGSSQIKLNNIVGTRSVVSNNLFVGGKGGINESSCSNIEKSDNIFLSQSQFAIATVPQYVRNSIGSYYDFQGILRNADIGVTRSNYNPANLSTGYTTLLENSTTNLLTYSDNFAKWLPNGDVSTFNYGISPDGSKTSCLVASGSRYNPANMAIGSTYTYSLHVKKGTGLSVNLYIDGTTTLLSTFTFSSELFSGTSAGCTTQMTKLVNGWYRLALTFTAPQASKNFHIFPVSGSVEFWGAQLEVGTVATSYIPSPTKFVSRASAKSYYGQGGILRYAGNDQAAYDYDPSTVRYENLVLWSEDLGPWTRSASSSLSPDATTAPDGTVSADLLTNTTGGDFVSGFNAVPLNVVSGAGYTASVYVKAGTSSKFDLRVISGTTDVTASANLSNGTLTGGSGSVISAGAGWYRVILPFTAQTVTANIYVYPRGQFASGTAGGVYIWGAQVNSGSTALEYAKTTDTAKPKTYMDKGFSVEAAGTNLYSYSGQFDNAVWSKSATSITPNATIGPNGATVAAFLREDSTTAAHEIRTPSVSLTAGTTYTQSVFAKAGSRRYLRVGFSSVFGGSNNYAVFDLQVGSVAFTGSGIASTAIQAVANGFYRCSVTFGATISASGTNYIGLQPDSTTTSYAGDGNSGMYIWGAQLEVGSSPTSYIPSSLTFTSRGSTGTYVDLNGVLQTAAANVARFTYEPSNLSVQPYLLLEAAATNYMYNSQSFTGWTGAVAVSGSTSSYRGVPYMTLAKTTSTSNENLASNGIAVAAGAYLTLTIALRAGTTTSTSVGVYDSSGGTVWGVNSDTVFSVIEGSGVVAQANGGLISVTGLSATADTVVQITRRYSASGTSQVLIYPGLSTSTTIGHSILATRVQLEDGRGATSYIPTLTSASASRSADVYTSSTGSRAADIVTSAVTVRAADTPSIRNNIYSPDIPIRVGDLTTTTVPYSYSTGGATIALPTPVAISVPSYNGDVVADPKLDPVTYAPLAGSPLLDTSWRDNIRMFTVPMAVSDK